MRPFARAGKRHISASAVQDGQNRRNPRLLRRSIRRGSAFCRQTRGAERKGGRRAAQRPALPHLYARLSAGVPVFGRAERAAAHAASGSTPRTKIPAGSVGIGGQADGHLSDGIPRRLAAHRSHAADALCAGRSPCPMRRATASGLCPSTRTNLRAIRRRRGGANAMTLKIVLPGPLTTVQDFGRLRRIRRRAIRSAAHATNTRWRWPICSAATASARTWQGLNTRSTGPTAPCGRLYARRADGRRSRAARSTERRVNDVRAAFCSPPAIRWKSACSSPACAAIWPCSAGLTSTPCSAAAPPISNAISAALNGRALKAGDVLPVLSRVSNCRRNSFRPLMQKRVRAAALEDWALDHADPSRLHRRAELCRCCASCSARRMSMFTEKGLFEFKSVRSTPSRRIPTAWPPSSTARRSRPGTGVDILSDGIVEGSVQISANGQPIVMLADHQITGGYAKIGDGHSAATFPRWRRFAPARASASASVTVEEGISRLQARKRKMGSVSRSRSTHD